MKPNKRPDEDQPAAGASFDLGGIFCGFSGLIEKLNELARTGEELRRSGELGLPGKEPRAIYGFTVKVGLGGEAPRVEPFGNVRRDQQTGRAVVQEIREPVVDLFEEKDYLLIVAEMPGISAADVKLEVKGDVLTLRAAKGDKKYRKELLLPASYPRDKMRLTCNNGVLEIKCFK